MSRDQNAGRSHNIKIGNSSFERVEQFKYMGTTLTNQNSIQEEIKCRFKSRKACYHSVQNLSPSILLSRKIKIYRTIILYVVLYWRENWSLTLREERRLRLFENRVLRRILWSKRDEVTVEWRKLRTWSLMICNHHQILFGWLKREWDGRSMQHLLGKGEVHTGFLGKPRETDHLEEPGIDEVDFF